MYKIVLRPRAEKQLLLLEKKDQSRIEEVIDALAENPFLGKKLKGEYSDFRSCRVWPYRIIYVIEKKIITITIVAIGHRKDVYRKS